MARKKTHRTTHKHVEHQDSTDIQKKTTLYFLCVSIFIFYLFKWFLQYNLCFDDSQISSSFRKPK